MGFIVPPAAKSWLKADPASDFPIQNLPFGCGFSGDDEPKLLTRIGESAIDILILIEADLLPDCGLDGTNGFADIGSQNVRDLRKALYDLFRESNPKLRDDPRLRRQAIVPVERFDMSLPMEIPSFVDFYSGINHASNVGKMFRPDMSPLLPNYRHLPVGYNGRVSSILPTQIPVPRPSGQTKQPDAQMPSFGPTAELDFELELGFFLSEGNGFAEPVPVGDAEDRIAGLVLVNDWSARDVQRWEYQPLGPFLAKSFATSISPWLVTLDALEPFRVAGPKQEPEPLPYLRPARPGQFDIMLEVALQTEGMSAPQIISRTNAKELYWSFAQQLAHQTSNGTPTEAGDLYATGTISGTEEGTFGSMLELAWRGTKPIVMEETGEERRFIEDGDTVFLSGYCQGQGHRVGFGTLENQVLPAL